MTLRAGLDKLADPEGFAQFVVEPFLGFLPTQGSLTFVVGPDIQSSPRHRITAKKRNNAGSMLATSQDGRRTL